ncbi:MAG: zinc-binding dehydrogenase [Candidatus Micrarchaeota archaeon]|nr:zinc-binding dehydrogenase [Candidatus Micrarchaeota archaeon]
MAEWDALVVEGKGKVRLKSVRGSGERHVRMLFCGVCGTDKHIIKGDIKSVTLPRVLGHECVGEADGKRYVWPAIIPCNVCNNCRSGRYNVCSQNQVFGLTTRNNYAGGWAMRSPLPKGTILFELPDGLASQSAVLVETVASTKPLHNLNLEGKELLIVGSGAIGLVGAIHAKTRNPAKITMIGHKSQAALLGGLIDEFHEKGSKDGALLDRFDVVYDAGGSPESYADAVKYVKPSGLVLESACMPEDFNVDLSGLMAKEARLSTQLGYKPEDFRWAMKLALENQKRLKKLISHRFVLEDHGKALDTMLNRRYGKIIFDCS